MAKQREFSGRSERDVMRERLQARLRAYRQHETMMMCPDIGMPHESTAGPADRDGVGFCERPLDSALQASMATLEEQQRVISDFRTELLVLRGALGAQASSGRCILVQCMRHLHLSGQEPRIGSGHRISCL